MTTDDIRVPKTATCPSLSGKTKLTFDAGANGKSEILVRITKTNGTGAFSKDWVALERVGDALEKAAGKPITAHTLDPLFRGQSANDPGFFLAVPKHEGLVGAAADNPRNLRSARRKGGLHRDQALLGAIKSPSTPTMKRR